MTLREVPIPADAGSVLIRVHAAGLNPIDYKVRQGKMRLLNRLDLPLRWQRARRRGGGGRAEGHPIRRRGPGVRQGGQVRAGAFADYAAVSESLIAKMPASLDFVQAGGLPLAGLTALQSLRDELGLSRGDRLYIAGGAGGVGTMAIQIAKWMGAEVATTASGRGGALARRLGADDAIDYIRARPAAPTPTLNQANLVRTPWPGRRRP